MTALPVLLVAVGVAVDAFAAALAKGLHMRNFQVRIAIVIAITFGAFQAVMPIIGWWIGTGFEQYVASVDHWGAFGLLVAIGGRMIWQAFTDSGRMPDYDRVDVPELMLLALATTIDALAVGISFALLSIYLIAGKLPLPQIHTIQRGAEKAAVLALTLSGRDESLRAAVRRQLAEARAPLTQRRQRRLGTDAGSGRGIGRRFRARDRATPQAPGPVLRRSHRPGPVRPRGSPTTCRTGTAGARNRAGRGRRPPRGRHRPAVRGGRNRARPD